MGRPCSVDLRERVVEAYEAGEGGYEALGQRFRVAPSAIHRWVRQSRREGHCHPKVYRHGFRSVLDEEDGAVLRRLVEDQNDATLAEYAERFHARTGCAVSPSGVCRALQRLGLTRKKKTVSASEQRRPDVAAKRGAFQEKVSALDPRRLVFLDETGIVTTLTRRYARAPHGQRASGTAPGHWEHLTVLGALGLEGPVGAVMIVAGGTTVEVFLSYLCTVLLPFLGEHKPDAVIVLDNLKSHHNETAQKAITDAGLTFIYLPPYSPEWAPIEECWSKIKEYLRSVAARTTQALREAMVSAMQSITPQDARGWFRHCGYKVADNVTGLPVAS